MHSGKMEFETMAKVLLLTAFLIVVLLMSKGVVDAYTDLGGVGVKEYTCWATDVMKANVIQIWPSTCRPQIVKEQIDMKNLGKFMGTCWWMYGQGKWDLGGKIDESKTSLIVPLDLTYTCYVFIPKEDIKVNALKEYMKQHNVKGEKVKKPEEALWNYLQIVSKGDNVCFDKYDDGVLKKGEIYYMKFVDNRAWSGTGKSDMLLISRDKEFFEYKTTFGRIEKWAKEVVGINSCYDYSTTNNVKPKADDLRESEKKSTEEFFNAFTKLIRECKSLAKGSICRCTENKIDFASGLPAKALIKVTPNQDKVTFKVYYDNQQIGNQVGETIQGKMTLQKSTTTPLTFKILENEFVFTNGRSYYLLLTENTEEFAISAIPISTSYPICE